MIWLAWRQFRTQGAAVIGVLAVLAVVLAVTGPHLVHLYDTEVAGCGRYGRCTAADRGLFHTDRLLRQLGAVLLVAPALVGIFWGAPLVARELETGTYKVAFTQSVSRSRWLVGKLAIGGLASVAACGLLSLMVTWWSSPFDRIHGDLLIPTLFDKRGVIPMGYGALAFALGVLAGLIIRRTLPAMAATVVAFIGYRLIDFEWIRPHLVAPVRSLVPLNLSSPTSSVSGWVLSKVTVNRSGAVIGSNGGIGPKGNISFYPLSGGRLGLSGVGICPGRVAAPGRLLGPPSQSNGPAITQTAQECVDKLGVKELLTYQPASRFWEFQWCELAIYLGLSVALLWLGVWLLRRRLGR